VRVGEMLYKLIRSEYGGYIVRENSETTIDAGQEEIFSLRLRIATLSLLKTKSANPPRRLWTSLERALRTPSVEWERT